MTGEWTHNDGNRQWEQRAADGQVRFIISDELIDRADKPEMANQLAGRHGRSAVPPPLVPFLPPEENA